MYRLLEITGGAATAVHWLDRRTERWEVTVRPHGDDDIVVVLPKDRRCTGDKPEEGAPCAAGHRELTNQPEITIPRHPAAGQSDATDNTPPQGRPEHHR